MMCNLYQLVSGSCLPIGFIVTLHHSNEVLIPTLGMYSSTSIVKESSVQISIKSSPPSKGQSPLTPSASASSVPEENSTNVIVPVLIAVMALFLVLLILLVTGIAISLLLRQRSKSKAKPTASEYACHDTLSLLNTADQSPYFLLYRYERRSRKQIL